MPGGIRWDDGRDGRPEAYNAEDCPVWVVYCPPPGQDSGPRMVREIRPGGFVGTRAAMEDVMGPYATREEAVAAAMRSGATVVG